MNASSTGILYIVPTPIGHLLDITYRGVKILKEVNIIAVENIYRTNILLNYFDIKKSLILFNKDNEKKQSKNLIQALQKGKNIALVSSAGTPLINDPGFFLIAQCHIFGIKVVPLPGACAAITALSASGISTRRFCYEGFLPSKNKLRQDLLYSLKEETRTMIFYETKHRILKSIKDIIEQIDKNRHIVLAKEITKKWESIHGTTTTLMLDWLKTDKYRYKGEIVIILDGFKKLKKNHLSHEIINTFLILKNCFSLKKAVSITSQIHQINKNNLYEYAIKKNDDKQ